MDKLMNEVAGKLKLANSPKNPALYTNEETEDNKSKGSPSPIKPTKGKKKGKKRIIKH
jgi:hypothetical protein